FVEARRHFHLYVLKGCKLSRSGYFITAGNACRNKKSKAAILGLGRPFAYQMLINTLEPVQLGSLPVAIDTFTVEPGGHPPQAEDEIVVKLPEKLLHRSIVVPTGVDGL